MSPASLMPSAGEVTERASEALRDDGALLLVGALDRDLIANLARASDRCYRWVEDLVRREGPEAVFERLAPGQRFVPTASSLSLSSLDPGVGFDVVRELVVTEPLRRVLVGLLNGPFSIDIDQAWLRRQYAPGYYPPMHAPHAWHQDGALGCDFAADPERGGGLLPLVTCWAPLRPCGRDAPGIEVLARPLDRVLAPRRLTANAVSREFASEVAWTPEMHPGDVLLMSGGALHRTHVTPGMTSDRTSVEVRAFPAGSVPPRLAGDRFSEPVHPSPAP